MKKPAISVVIPTFNEEKYLPHCLTSLKKQTFPDFEIIVVDNNSSDQTVEIAKSFGAKIIKEKKQGTVYARERGFRTAQAPIIARTDADTEVSPNWLETIFSTFQKNPKVVAVTGIFTSRSYFLGKLFRLYSDFSFNKFAKLFTGHVQLVGSNMAIRKEIWEKTKPHIKDRFVHEDIDLSCHLAPFGETLYLPTLSVTLSLRRVRENPLWGTINYGVLYILRYIYTLLLHHPLPQTSCRTS